jgi:hypothetical protein
MRARGWKISDIGSSTGHGPLTTVYPWKGDKPKNKWDTNSDTIKLSPHGCQVQIINWLAYPSLPMYLICF